MLKLLLDSSYAPRTLSVRDVACNIFSFQDVFSTVSVGIPIHLSSRTTKLCHLKSAIYKKIINKMSAYWLVALLLI